MFLRTSALIFAIPAFTVTVLAAEKLGYNRDVRPILADKCFACHGFDAKHRESELRLDMAAGAGAKTESGGVALKPGNAAESEAWQRIMSTDADEVMPPPKSHKTLSAREKEMIHRWIEEGAVYEDHWSFKPAIRPAVPAGGSANPIDAFIIERLQSAGLTPAPPTDKATLLRRVTLDLTGLPPTIEELDAFLTDQAPDAYERVVDRLLTSPRHGERMAAQWLDLARFGDTNGYLHDIRRTGWPWRDWVIKAFIDDLPFDQFVIEQLAGDLLPNATPEQILATGFSRNHPITAEGGTIAAEYLNEYAANRAETVGTAFLGLTMNCCRCHDHKFDPLKQEDFYGMLAFFNSTTEKHEENKKDAAYAPFIEIASPLAPLGPKAQVMVMQEAAAPVPTFVLTRGQYDQPNANRPAPRKPPTVLGELPPGAPVNRLGLSQWIVAPQNPLFTRVTVNRLWQQFFDTGIVKSVDDFGLQGEYPSHPELLDWLAVEFREGGGKPWSLRHVMRLIVTSATYRQSSQLRPEIAAKDPHNRLLAYFPRQRLSAEQIRDQALFVAGLMSLDLGGAPVFPYQPPGLWEERSNEGSNTKSYTLSTGAALYRRSLYTFWKRTSPPPFMTIFDAPDRMACSVRRSPTNTPLQALATLNDEQLLECAKMLAARTLQKAATTPERLTWMFRSATGRTPSADDLRNLDEGLESLLLRYQAAPDDAVELLKQGAMPPPVEHNAPELAAWMLIASTVLNLDET
ncbi:MAG: DUF1553 domain-containing protein, partial [Verrucomicrobia bacterium]|nr:DUF1553 domain-containing protein [Verrucomicrobiota bacterium]